MSRLTARLRASFPIPNSAKSMIPAEAWLDPRESKRRPGGEFSLVRCLSDDPCVPAWGSEEQAAEGVSEPEEDEDHQRHHGGDQTHHRQELGACLPVHYQSRDVLGLASPAPMLARIRLPRGIAACIVKKVVGTGAERHPGTLTRYRAGALERGFRLGDPLRAQTHPRAKLHQPRGRDARRPGTTDAGEPLR